MVAGPDARHHVWYGPEGYLRSKLVLLVTLRSRCVPFCSRQAQMLCTMAGMFLRCRQARRTVTQRVVGSAVAVHPRRRFPCRGAEVDSRGPDASSDQRDSPVAPQHGDRCPCCTVVQDILVGTPRLIPMVSLTIEIPSSSLTRQLMSLLHRSCRTFLS